jgi:hypothetical protein
MKCKNCNLEETNSTTGLCWKCSSYYLYSENKLCLEDIKNKIIINLKQINKEVEVLLMIRIIQLKKN